MRQGRQKERTQCPLDTQFVDRRARLLILISHRVSCLLTFVVACARCWPEAPSLPGPAPWPRLRDRQRSPQESAPEAGSRMRCDRALTLVKDRTGGIPLAG